MSKLKKILLMALSLVLVAAMSIGGTVAYLQDDDSDVNVMTLGSVKIEQHEYERKVDANGGYVTDNTGYVLQGFTQDKPLYPATIPTNSAEWTYGTTNVMFEQVGANGGGMNVFVEPNAVDKFVFVKNAGKTDAYVRTLIAFESGSLSTEEWDEVVSTSYHFSWGEPVVIGSITVENNNYVVLEYTYEGRPDKGFHENGILPAGEVTQCSLGQVYMRSTATNEDCEAIDGDKDGKYNILVLSQAVQTAGFANAKTALDTAFGKSSEKAAEWFDGVWAKHVPDLWDGSVDTTWYNDTDTEFTLTTAEQLAGLAKLVDDGNTFTGKTVKVGKNLDLRYVPEGATESQCFNPIGSYRKDKIFKGTFDGQSHTIANMSQNTWALDNGYYYGDLGLGLFGMVEDATIKNLTMDGASISGESAICGSVAACAYGECTFENITVKNSKVNDYQYYAGGVVGWASGDHTYKNINVDASTTVGSQWGDFGNANGGIIGGAGTSGTYHFEDCTVACRIDATNDVVSAYQWYNYRNSGMLIGKVGPETIVNEVTTVTADNVTCKNVTVIYDDWANYTYCEFAGTGYPYVRVQAGVSVDAYSNVRYGHPTDANGNTVVDDNHVHNDGEAHHELIAFDYLFGGPANHRYCYYGISEHPGVTVIYNNK